MRKTLLPLASAVLFVALTTGVHAQNVGINRNGAAPNARAILDLDVSGTSGNPYQGMLIPRMTRAQRLAIAAGNPAVAGTGLWVYQTDNDPSADPALAHGYWYWDGAAWQRWSASGNGWKLTGNANTAVATNYLGTPVASNDDLYVRTTNNVAVNPAIRINAANGFTGFNMAAAPVEMGEVNGGVQVGNTNTITEGGIKHENTAAIPARFHYGNVDGTAAGWLRLENAETRYTNEQYCPVAMQCLGDDGMVIRGTYDNTPLAGFQNTPFPTAAGTNNQRGHRVQYIYPASELLAIGLCAGNITKFSFYSLSTDYQSLPTVDNPCEPDPTAPGGLTCPELLIDIRMGNSALTNFGAAVVAQAGALPVNWDGPTEASAPINVPPSPAQQLIQNGWNDFTLAGAGFPWDGTSSLIIDVSWIRQSPIGTSPAFQLEEALGYTATKWVRPNTAISLAHGNTYQDNPMAANFHTGNTNNRPVTRFYGKVQSAGYGAATTGNYLNYGGGVVLDTNAAPGAISDAAYRGPGTIKAMRAAYDGTTQLSDHVFDRYFDGEVAPADAKAAEGYAYVGLPALKDYLERERHLPSMPSRAEWEEHGTRPIGELQTGLWESVETQALYITQLEKDLSAMEALAFGKTATPQDLERMLADIKASRRLSEAQKLHLTNALRARYAQDGATK